MGICNSNQKKPNPKDLQQIYGFKNKFNSSIKPFNQINRKLHFEVRIFNIQAKNLEEKFYFIKILFLNTELVSKITSGKEPKFNIDKTFSIDIQFEEMEKNNMEIYLYAIPKNFDLDKLSSTDDYMQKNPFISLLKIDVLTCLIGPEHHDIHLYNRIKSEYQGRISIHVKCEQEEPMDINISQFECTFNHIHHNDLSFKLKFSDTSYFHQKESNILELKHKINNAEGTTIYTYDSLEKENLFSFQNMDLTMNELKSSILTLKIYDQIICEDIFQNNEFEKESMKIKIKQSTKHFSGKMLDSILEEIGTCHINLNQILSENDNTILKLASKVFQKHSNIFSGPQIEERKIYNQTDQNFEMKEKFTNEIKFKVFENLSKSVKEKIYFKGSEIGIFSGKIVINSIPLIRQIICGVHTENGLDVNSNYLTILKLDSNSSVENVKLPDEINELDQKLSSLLNILVNSTELNQMTQETIERKRILGNHLQEIKSLLNKTSKEGCYFYNYLNEIEIIKSQEVMLKIGLELIQLIENLNTEHRNISLSIIEAICERGEFDLSSMSIDQTDSNSEYIKLKINISSIYLNFLHKLLKFCLEKLSKLIVDENIKNFVEFFLSLSYFRIPKFRKEFLQTITKNMDGLDYSEFSKIEKRYEIEVEHEAIVDKDQSIHTSHHSNLSPIALLLDWEKLFYNKFEKLISKELLSEMNNELEELISKNDWKERIEKRGKAFFSIIKKLEIYIQRKLVIERNIDWLHINGFRKIIQAITVELKNREIIYYHVNLIEVLKSFINDHDIMNLFSKTILTKTNAFDVHAVFASIRIMDSFFQEYDAKKTISNFGFQFDYQILQKATDIILKLDHSLCISKVLWLFYRNSHIMSIEFISEIVIINNSRFFFHWSFHVRNVFYHYLYYSIQYRLNLKNFNEDRKHISQKRIEKLRDRDNKGLMETLTFNYPEQLKAKILQNYYDKMKIIEKIKGISKKEKKDFNNTQFLCTDESIMNLIDETSHKHILISLQQADQIYQNFKKWEKDAKKDKIEPKYPEINIQLPKDDYIRLDESW